VPGTRDPTPRTLPHSYIGSLDKSHRFGKSPGSRPRIIAFSPYCRIAPLPDCLPTQTTMGPYKHPPPPIILHRPLQKTKSLRPWPAPAPQHATPPP